MAIWMRKNLDASELQKLCDGESLTFKNITGGLPAKDVNVEIALEDIGFAEMGKCVRSAELKVEAAEATTGGAADE